MWGKEGELCSRFILTPALSLRERGVVRGRERGCGLVQAGGGAVLAFHPHPCPLPEGEGVVRGRERDCGLVQAGGGAVLAFHPHPCPLPEGEGVVRGRERGCGLVQAGRGGSPGTGKGLCSGASTGAMTTVGFGPLPLPQGEGWGEGVIFAEATVTPVPPYSNGKCSSAFPARQIPQSPSSDSDDQGATAGKRRALSPAIPRGDGRR